MKAFISEEWKEEIAKHLTPDEMEFLGEGGVIMVGLIMGSEMSAIDEARDRAEEFIDWAEHQRTAGEPATCHEWCQKTTEKILGLTDGEFTAYIEGIKDVLGVLPLKEIDEEIRDVYTFVESLYHERQSGQGSDSVH